MDSIFVIILAISAPLGMLIGFYAHKQFSINKASSAEAKAQNILREAEAKKKELFLQAKDKALLVIEEAKKEEERMKSDLRNIQTRLEKRESLFDQRILDLENKQQKVVQKAAEVEEIKEQIGQIRQQQIDKLEKVAALDREQAKQLLMENVEQSMADDLMQRIRKLEDTNQEHFENKAREILSIAIQAARLLTLRSPRQQQCRFLPMK